MTNHEEKGCYRGKKSKKESAKKVTEYVIYNKLFIGKHQTKNKTTIYLSQIPVQCHTW